MKIDERVIEAYRKANPEDHFCQNLPSILEAYEAAKVAEQPVGRTLFEPNIHCDAQRVIAWIDNPKRKAAQMAFTEGLERQIAYRFDDAMMKRESSDLSDLKPYVQGYFEFKSMGINSKVSQNADYMMEKLALYFHQTDIEVGGSDGE